METSKIKWKKIDIIERRIDFLEKRIEESDKDLSFDKAESAALQWIIDEYLDLYYILNPQEEHEYSAHPVGN